MSDHLNKILTDDLSQEEVDMILEDAIQAKFDAELKQELKKKLARQYGLPKKQKTIDRKIKRRQLLYFLAAAAAGVALLILSLPLFSPSSENARQLASSYLTGSEITHSGTLKGDSGNPDTRLEAIRAFNSRNYDKAIYYFSLIEDKTQEDLFYSGVASLYQEKYYEAIEKLRPLSQTTSNYQTEAMWYLALAHILNGEEALAKEVLLKMEDETWNQDKTRKLLRAIE